MEANTEAKDKQQVQILIKPQKKTLLVRRKLEEDIKNAKDLANHPQLQNVKIITNVSNQNKSGLKASQSNLYKMSHRTIDQQNKTNKESLISNGKSFQSIEALNQQQQQQQISSQEIELANDYKPEVQGPQLVMNKTHISFVQLTGKCAFDSVTVRNNGTASIYYEWKKIPIEQLHKQSLQEVDEKFYCHHQKNVIKPGEQKKFVFAFLSKITGIFNQEMILECEPPTVTSLSKLKLSGHAIEVDTKKEWRRDLDSLSYKSHVKKLMLEYVNDILDRVKTPTPPLPDLNNPEICRAEFESKNQQYHLWYNPLIMKWWRNLEQELYGKLKLDPAKQYWNLNVDYLKNLISTVFDEQQRQFFEKCFYEYFEMSKVRPLERSTIYPNIKEKLVQVIEKLPQISDDLRKELDMWDYSFAVPPENDLSEEEKKTKEEEFQKMKAEWLKKTKKKKWTDDDNNQLIEKYRGSLQERVKESVMSSLADTEKNDQYIRLKSQMADQPLQLTKEFIERTLRKKSVKDVDIDGRRILLRVHLKIQDTEQAREKKKQHEERIVKMKEEEEKRIEEEKIQAELEAKNKKKGKKMAKKGKKDQVEEKKEEPKFDISFLDQDNLKQIVATIKYLIDRLAKLVIILPSYDEPIGEYRFVSSTKFFYEYLKSIMETSTIMFNEGCLIENYQEKIESEQFSDQTIIILENAFFSPEEVGFKYVKPIKQEQQKSAEQPNQEGQEEVKKNEEQPNEQDEQQLQQPPQEEVCLMKYQPEDKKQYIDELNSYCPIYIIDIKDNSLFQNYTSLNMLDIEQIVAGEQLHQNMVTSTYFASLENYSSVLLMGGNVTPDKIMVMNNYLDKAEKIFLLGQFGYQMYLIQSKKQELSNLKLNDMCVQTLTLLLEKASKTKTKIIIPTDFSIAESKPVIAEDVEGEKQQQTQQQQNNQSQLPSNQESQIEGEVQEVKKIEPNSNEWYLELVAKKQNWDTQKMVEVEVEGQEAKVQQLQDNTLPEDSIILDYGEKTQKEIEKAMMEYQLVGWFNNLSILDYPAVYFTNTMASKILYQRQQEQKTRLEENKSNIKYNYEKDQIVFHFGSDIERVLNSCEIVEKKKAEVNIDEQLKLETNQNEANEQDEESQDYNKKSQSKLEAQSEKQQTIEENKDDNKSVYDQVNTVKKINNLELVSNFFVKDGDFACKILTGNNVESINRINQYVKSEENDLDEFLQMLEEAAGNK